MQSRGIATGPDAGAFAITADEEVARRCAARLLISASTAGGVETIARRIHEAGPRARRPFLQLWAVDFPVDPQALREYCSIALDRAPGGSLLIDAVEEMPQTVQDTLIELLDGLEFSRRPRDAVRLISGTTVSLFERVAAGTFSEQLFYRLNIIHLMAVDGALSPTRDDDAQDVDVIEPSAPKLSR